MIASFPLILVNDNFLSLTFLLNCCCNSCSGYGWASNLQLAVVNNQHLVKCYGLACACAQSLYLNDIAFWGKVGKTSFTLGEKVGDIVDVALKGVAVAMGVAVAVLSILNQIGTGAALGMLGIGLACLAISQLSDRKE